MLLKLLAEQRLVALLGSRALAAAPDALPSSFRDSVARAVAANRSRGLALDALTGHLVGKLEAAGIPVLALKGPLLARRLHGDEGMRATNDLDLLVERGALSAATEVLEGVGYRVERGLHVSDPELHLTLRAASGRLTRIDLHWRIHWYEDDFSRDLLARSAPGAGGVREPRPGDELAALLLFYARDGFAGLRLAADVAAFWDTRGEAIQFAAMAAIERDHPALAPALATAASAAERLVGLPAARAFGASPKPSRVLRLADWTLSESTRQSRANVHLADILLAGRAGFPAALHRTFLTPARDHAEGPLRPLATFDHALRLARRFGLALWRRRNGRSPVPPLPGATG